MAMGGHGVPKVSAGPAMPYPLRHVGGPPLKRSKGSAPTSQVAWGPLLPLWTPHTVGLWFIVMLSFQTLGIQ
jgi:hypothetical protein